MKSKTCYNCKHFKYYNHFSENVHCKKHGVYQFGFGQNLTCGYWEGKVMSLELYEIFVKCFAEVDKRPKIMDRKTKD